MKENLKTVAIIVLSVVAFVCVMRSGALRLTIKCQADTINKLEKEIADLKNPKQSTGEIKSLAILNQVQRF